MLAKRSKMTYRKQDEKTEMAKLNSIKEETHKNVSKQLGKTFQTPISYSYNESQRVALFLKFI